MTIYWRVQDIPELRAVPTPLRKRLWSEAVTRSRTARQIALLVGLSLAVPLSVVATADLLGYRSGWMHEGILFAAPALAAFASEYWLAQPRARRWLREHAHELGRYVRP
ncbi:MAG: hypothetical protein ABI128_03360 [Rhodanobacter sp.]